MILLDTSIFIDFFRKTQKENTILHNILSGDNKICISVITHYELLIGITPKQKTYWDLLLENIAVLDYSFLLNEIAVDTHIQLKKINKLIPFQDLIIGATAKYYNYTLATLNTKHFKNIDGIVLYNSITKNE